MDLTFTENAWEDYLYWQQVDKKMARKINELIKSIQRTSFEGVGNLNLSNLICRDIGPEELIASTGWCTR